MKGKANTLISLAILGISFLSGCYKPAKGITPLYNVIMPTGQKSVYAEEHIEYDEKGNQIVIREHFAENPNSLRVYWGMAKTYFELRIRGLDLLELKNKRIGKE